MGTNLSTTGATILVALFESRQEVEHIVSFGLSVEIERQTALDFVW
jgi:hypothetical protein